jgi:flagellar assembly protein FliH
LLANPPKHSSLPSAESCALYYFPEIPCSIENPRAKESTQDHFVNGAFDRIDAPPGGDAQPQDSEQIQQLIEEAFNKGVEQGRNEVIASQKDQVDGAALALGEALREMARLRRRDVDQMETETVRLALAIAKKIIGYETETGSVIGPVVQMAMQKVADPRHLTVRLNPRDIDTVKTFKGEWFPDDEVGAVFRLEADEAIGQGGCIVETNLGDVDARIDQQIRIIEARLTELLPKPHTEG